MAVQHEHDQGQRDGESDDERPSLLDRTVSYEEMIDDGARQIYPQTDFRRWFRDRDALTVREVLAVRTHLSWVFWAVMREDVLPGKILHVLATQYAREFLTRMSARPVYIDFRTERALAAKESWLDERISLGELRAAEVSARRAYDDVTDYGEREVAACASMVCLALRHDGQDAQRRAFYYFLEYFPLRADQRWLLKRARTTLAEHDVAYA